MDLKTYIIQNLLKEGRTILPVEQNSNLALEISVRGYAPETERIAIERNANNLMNNEHIKRAYLGA